LHFIAKEFQPQTPAVPAYGQLTTLLSSGPRGD
jgi:hypothetical protein